MKASKSTQQLMNQGEKIKRKNVHVFTQMEMGTWPSKPMRQSTILSIITHPEHIIQEKSMTVIPFPTATKKSS